MSQRDVINQIFKELDNIRENLFQTIEMLPSSVFEPRFDSKWNAPKILGHLAKFETLLAEFFQNYILPNAKKVSPAKNPKRLSENWKDAMANDSKKYEAPEILRSKAVVKNSYKELFIENREKLKQAVYQKIDKDFDSIVIPHPNGTKLNLVQWLELFGAHEKRHIRQLEHLSF